jgi:two-component system, OmpR family, KDP operon response regulator KdpE
MQARPLIVHSLRCPTHAGASDSVARQVQLSTTQGDQEIKLTRKEFDLISCLAPPRPHSEDTQYLRVYIRQLRQTIEMNPGDPRIICTEIGIGCRIAETT